MTDCALGCLRSVFAPVKRDETVQNPADLSRPFPAPEKMAIQPSGNPLRLSGRENECHCAIGAVLAAQRSAGQAICFIGPQGIGKSLLLREIAARIDDLMPEALVCEGSFGPGSNITDLILNWGTRLSLAAMGQRPGRSMPIPDIKSVSAQAGRRSEILLREQMERLIQASHAPTARPVVEVFTDLARLAVSRFNHPVVLLLDDLHELLKSDPSSAAALQRLSELEAFTWIAATLPVEDVHPLLRTFRRYILTPLDLASAAQVVEVLCGRRGHNLTPESSRALAACLEGHGALSEDFARELSQVNDPEPGLDTHVRLLLATLEHGAFASTVSAALHALVTGHDQRREVLEALVALHEMPNNPPLPILLAFAQELRELGLLDWQSTSVAPTPLWIMRQLIHLWNEVNLRDKTLRRSAQVLKRMQSLAPAGEAELEAGTLTACVSALSGVEIESDRFAAMPRWAASAGRMRMPMVLACEAVDAAEALRYTSAGPPDWIVMAGMVGMPSMDEGGHSSGEVSFWLIAAFSPPITVREDDVRQIRQAAEGIAMDTAGVRPTGVWIIGGDFDPSAERMAEIEGIFLSSWSAWRALNALPQPSAEQMESESRSLFDPSGLAFTLDLNATASPGTSSATEALDALAERAGFNPAQRRKVLEAFWAATGDRPEGRLRARQVDQTLHVILELENPRWRNGQSTASRKQEWDLNTLRGLMDQVIVEQLPWGRRLRLIKRLDLFYPDL